ncbi:type VI secretion system baseplate subunit TssE [Azoarcus sp. TTM-91]|uniref:type VI secretion system baseplate subunit TssE n=1 Tax=Azoarcus sp. TTM-91 TaxID=2691581 RepID=UPI00145DB1A3|nr:type VI secretion system baseplate subunit TssE [Azoarcus sp. TTM-91]NMG34984.1 type VI secretion system baseplate subunit TssE [Azoarcus sp. TTM-91]
MPRVPGRGSLFERLTPELPPYRARSPHDLAAERVQAVKRHLEWILNTRRGSAPSCPELGLPDFNDAAIGSEDLRLTLCTAIHQLITRFEPRVQQVEVRSRPEEHGPALLQFRVHCVMPVDGVKEQVEIDLLIHCPDQFAKVP